MEHFFVMLAGWTGAFALASLAIWEAKELVAARREVRELTIRLVKLRVRFLTGKDLVEYEDEQDQYRAQHEERVKVALSTRATG